MARAQVAALLLISLPGCFDPIESQSDDDAHEGFGGDLRSRPVPSEGGGPSDAGGMGGMAGSGGASGVACGNTFCGTNEACHDSTGQCGADPTFAVCTPIPAGCPDVDEPTCGCDGVVYANSCEALLAGTDASESVSCTPPSNVLYQCGSGFCATAGTYCIAHEQPTDTVYECGQIPSKCGGPGEMSCACVSDLCTISDCGVLPSGRVLVTCAAE